MRAESVHVSVGGRDASVGHHDGHLVEGFGKHCPEVPVSLWRTEIGLWVTLHGMVQVRKLQRVADEEHGGIVAHQVPIPFLGIKLHGKASDVAFGIGSSPFACYGREAYEYIRLFPDFREELGTGVWGHIVRYGEVSVGSASLGMHPSLGNDLPVKVGQLFDEPGIFQ